MLTREQLLHFAEHGWIIKEKVFDESFLSECRRVMDDTAAAMPARRTDEDKVMHLGLLNHHPFFRDCLLNPTLIEDARQLTGTELRHRATWMIIKRPHPERHRNRDGLVDPENLGWHRDMRPKWGTFAHDDDPELVNCILINCMISVTDVGPERGGTVALDGSHKVEGDPANVMRQCPVVQFEARRGSVIYFTETLTHAAFPILGEEERYVLFLAFVPPWFEVWQHCDVEQEIVDSCEDETLRAIIGGNDGWGYPGQYQVG